MSSSSHLLHSPLAEKLQSPNNSTCDLNSTFQTESFAITILIYLYDILTAWDHIIIHVSQTEAPQAQGSGKVMLLAAAGKGHLPACDSFTSPAAALLRSVQIQTQTQM